MNIAGILLVVLAVALFVVEFFTSGYALFGAAGVLALILGLILIFDFAVPVWVTVTLFILILGTLNQRFAARVAARRRGSKAKGSHRQ